MLNWYLAILAFSAWVIAALMYLRQPIALWFAAWLKARADRKAGQKATRRG